MLTFQIWKENYVLIIHFENILAVESMMMHDIQSNNSRQHTHGQVVLAP